MSSVPSDSDKQAAPEGDKASLYRIAYSEAIRALEDQRDELNGVRGRAVQFLAFVGAATAFLVGTGLSGSGERDLWFYSIAVSATLFSVGAIHFCRKVLDPRIEFGQGASAKVIVEKWIERQVPRPTESELLRELAVNYDDEVDENEKTLAGLRTLYLRVITSGAVSVLVWAGLAWRNG